MRLTLIVAAAGFVACSGSALDSSTKSGEPASAALTDCDGVVPPALGAGQSAAVAYRWAARSDDGIGHVVFGKANPNDPSQSDTLWTLYPTDQGATPAPIAVMEGEDMFPTGCELSLESQPSGFVGTDCTNFTVTLRSWNHNGQLINSTALAQIPQSSVRFAIDPSGGTSAFRQYATGGTWHMDYLHFDKTGALTVNVPFISGPVTSSDRPTGPAIRGLGTNLAGHTLVILEDLQNGGLEGAWMEKTGVSHPFFATTVSPQNTGVMQFLPDGTLALREDRVGGWTSVFADLGRAALPAPAWLQQSNHRFADFFVVRGGRAIAIQSLDSTGGVDLISSAGNYCGSISVPVQANGGWSVGRDGTLATVGTDADPTARWYPQLLK